MSCSVFLFMDNSKPEWYQTDGVYHILKSTLTCKILLCLAWTFYFGMIVVTNKHKNTEVEFEFFYEGK